MKKIAIASGIMLAAAAMTAQAHPEHEGYVTQTTDTIWRTGFGECWRNGFWKEEDAMHAVEGCDGYKKPVVAEPAPAPKPAPAPAPKPVVKNMQVTEEHIVYFDFDSAEVKSVAEITSYVAGLTKLEGITLSGHTDKLGANEYNLALSRKRVNAVADALVEGGVDRSLIATDYLGESKPVKTCAKDTKTCLAENRRVEVTINGVKQVQQ